MKSWNRASLSFVVALALCPEASRATEAVVETTFTGQFYTVRSPYGDPVVRRRRYTHTLGLHVFDIGGDAAAGGPELFFRSRMRLDADFGQLSAERSVNDEGRYIPELEEAPLDLMYGYLEGRGYLGGWAGFRLGRQYVVDALGFWSFDGAMVRVTTPAFVQMEAYAGFEQRGALPMLSTSRFESDGVYRGSRDGLELDQYPELLLQERLAPALGVALETAGPHWIHGRLSYRRVLNRDVVRLTPYPLDGSYRTIEGTRISSERVGYAVRASDAEWGAADGKLVYDLYLGRLTSYGAGLDWYTTSDLTLGAEMDYWYPSFDGDSVFNWFSHSGISNVVARSSLRLSPRADLAFDAGVRIYQTDGDPNSFALDEDDSDASSLLDYVGHATGRYRWAEARGRAVALAEVGERGHRVGGDLSLERYFFDGFYDTLVVLSLYDWEDALRPQRSATSFTYVLGGGVSPGLGLFSDARLGVEWEHSVNRLVGHRFRALATLDLSVFR